jgi:hypothetical protein
MRRIALVVALCLLAGCSGNGGGAPGSIDRGAEIPTEVARFLDGVAEPGAVAFSATYDVFAKLGSVHFQVTVASAPPRYRIDLDDVATVVVGPDAFSCRLGSQSCEPGVQEQLLSSYDVHSGFFSTGPAAKLVTAAKRVGAGTARRSTRALAGLDLDCLAVPYGDVVVITACLTPEGVFAYVDDSAQTLTLVAYRSGPSDASFEPPYPVARPASGS